MINNWSGIYFKISFQNMAWGFGNLQICVLQQSLGTPGIAGDNICSSGFPIVLSSVYILGGICVHRESDPKVSSLDYLMTNQQRNTVAGLKKTMSHQLIFPDLGSLFLVWPSLRLPSKTLSLPPFLKNLYICSSSVFLTLLCFSFLPLSFSS